MFTPPTKVCNKCHREKPIDAFYIADKATGRRRSTCIKCLSHLNGDPPPPPITKVCTKCYTEKPVEEFPFRNVLLRKRHSVCSECSAKRANQWYYENREQHIQDVGNRRRASRDEARQYVISYLSTHPCVDCGEANPNKLEFDHHGDKEFDITHMLYKGFSIPHIAAEISKCEVRCANCHRRKTASERGWYRETRVT